MQRGEKPDHMTSIIRRRHKSQKRHRQGIVYGESLPKPERYKGRLSLLWIAHESTSCHEDTLDNAHRSAPRPGLHRANERPRRGGLRSGPSLLLYRASMRPSKGTQTDGSGAASLPPMFSYTAGIATYIVL